MPRKKSFQKEYCDLVKEEIRLDAILLTEALKRKELDTLRDVLTKTQVEQEQAEAILCKRIEQQANTIRSLQSLLDSRSEPPAKSDLLTRIYNWFQK